MMELLLEKISFNCYYVAFGDTKFNVHSKLNKIHPHNSYVVQIQTNRETNLVIRTLSSKTMHVSEGCMNAIS